MDIRSMVRRMLPTGRASTDLVRREQVRQELKVVLADYYSAMTSAGVYSTYRAKPWPIERAVAEAYERLVYVYKATEAIAGHSSRLPYRLRDGENVLDDHPMYRPLNRQANPLETAQQFRKRLTLQVLLSKRGAFVEKTKSASGAVVRVDLLPPGRTRPVPGTGDDLVSHFEVLRLDGTTQDIDVENVIWFREPHPLDPFSGVTPLEAAGLSIELDFFARLYNTTFLKNDGRPGGIIAVEGEMDDWSMAELRSRFGAGAHEAGKLTVVEGQVSYVDVAARPRDMQHEQTAKISKQEILTAFGVGESVLGYAADRTYENAEQELYNFWTITMPPMLTLLATGFDGDTEDNLEGFFDLSEVEVLQRAEIARRAEAREEHAAGLITIDEYRERVGLQVFDMPRTRALWVPSGKTLVATSEEDQKKLDEEAAAKLPPALAANLAPGMRDGSALPPGADDQQRPADNDEDDEGEEGASKAVDRRPLAAPTRPPVAALPPAPAKPVLRLVRPETKADTVTTSSPDLAARDRLETVLAAAVTAVMLRLVERTATRLTSTRLRKGTRHWVAEYEVDTRVGTKALDAGGAVDSARWGEEVERAAHPVVAAAATAAATALVADLTADGDGGGGDAALASLVASVLALLGSAALAQAEQLRVLIVAMDQDGAGMEEIAVAVREQAAGMPRWAERVAVQAATATVNGARDAAAAALVTVGRAIDKIWRSRGDEQVRPTHVTAHGQVQPHAEWFEVGEALLRYPGDPSGPPKETYGCRCWAMHRSRVSGQFVAAPEGRTRYSRAEREEAARAS